MKRYISAGLAIAAIFTALLFLVSPSGIGDANSGEKSSMVGPPHGM
jgi:hypothetical protein